VLWSDHVRSISASSVPPFSVLDLSPIVAGSDAAESFRGTLELARHAERLGYQRYWLAEHHNMPGIGSSATAVLIGYVASGTRTIRVGAGGIMLPNHAPLVIAEQFGTLVSLHGPRIDLGVGRAPGADRQTMQALRRHLAGDIDRFPDDVLELLAYFAPLAPGQPIRAVPGAGLDVPVWMLGSSDYSARLAARLGLPFAFASHFAPEYLHTAIERYRDEFQPSARLAAPYVMVTLNVVAAESDRAAARLFTSVQQQFANALRGRAAELPPPVDDIGAVISPLEMAAVAQRLHYAVVGAPARVERGLRAFLAATHADELLVTGHIHDHAARLRSFEIVSDIRAALGRGGNGEEEDNGEEQMQHGEAE
jgi:luciferase family oxidoreductase group 1